MRQRAKKNGEKEDMNIECLCASRLELAHAVFVSSVWNCIPRIAMLSHG